MPDDIDEDELLGELDALEAGGRGPHLCAHITECIKLWTISIDIHPVVIGCKVKVIVSTNHRRLIRCCL